MRSSLVDHQARGSLIGIVIGLLLAGCSQSMDVEVPSVSTERSAAPSGGASAPVRIMTLSEIQTELAARRNAGRPVLLNFWATWCGPCIEELPDLSDLAREFGDDGPELIGLSLDTWVFSSEAEAEERVRAALERAGASYVNLIHRGERSPLMERFDLPGPLPYSVLYDGEGREVTSWNGKVVIDQLRRAVAEME